MSLMFMPWVAAGFMCTIANDPEWHPVWTAMVDVAMFSLGVLLVFTPGWAWLGFPAVLLPISSLTEKFGERFQEKFWAYEAQSG